MTGKEFINLKPGDRVFYVTNWWDGTEEYKAYELEVRGKKTGKDGQNIVLTYCESGDKNCRCGGHNLDARGVGLTKAEAWKAEIELVEERIKRKEAEIAEDRECLDRYKAELAKAKEEEERGKKVWFVDFRDDRVEWFDKEHWERSIESTYFKNKSYVKICDTEQEAYEALAKCCERKLFKALEKCGYKFAICCDKNIAVVKIDTDNGEFFWGHYYPHLSYGSIRKTNVFDTLEEAEAELERRKK